MLVLSRRVDQSIVVGADIVITVLDIRGDQVRLGVRAPRDIAVHREEVAADIRAANEQAARSGQIDPSQLPPPADSR